MGLGGWNFPGAWRLELGAFPPPPAPGSPGQVQRSPGGFGNSEAGGQSSKDQDPSSRKAPRIKSSNTDQPTAHRREGFFGLGGWNFSGAWRLELGAFPPPPAPGRRGDDRKFSRHGGEWRRNGGIPLNHDKIPPGIDGKGRGMDKIPPGIDGKWRGIDGISPGIDRKWRGIDKIPPGIDGKWRGTGAFPFPDGIPQSGDVLQAGRLVGFYRN